MIKYHDHIITMNKPVNPIKDMITQVRAFRKVTKDDRLDHILQELITSYFHELKKGPVEFSTGLVFCFPDGETYPFDHQGKLALIAYADEKYGIDLTFKVRPYEVITSEVDWIMDIKE